MIKSKYKITSFDIAVWGISAIMLLFFAFPLLFIVANAFSDPIAVYSGQVNFIPIGFTLENIFEVFREEKLMQGLFNTIWYTVVGTILQVVLQFSVAYPLSRKDFKGKTFVNIFFALPMFISGGMIPTYLVVKFCGFLNTPWAIIIPGCLGLYNIIITRTYLTSSIPYDLTEAAMIDGCGVIGCLFKVILPLCKPIICVMLLYGIVGYWNSYFNSLIYTTKEELWPLQRVLQRMLMVNSSSSGSLGEAESLMKSESLKYAIILVASAPLLILYPFFQKYFETGMMIGSIKG